MTKYVQIWKWYKVIYGIKTFDGSKPKSSQKHPKKVSLVFQPKEIHWKPALLCVPEVMPSFVLLPDTVSYSLGSDQWPWASALLQAPRTSTKNSRAWESALRFGSFFSGGSEKHGKGVERRVKDCISCPTLRSVCIHFAGGLKRFLRCAIP